MEQIHQELGRHLLVSAFVVEDLRIGVTFIDISAQKKIEATLENARWDLARQVDERTSELSRANQELQSEVAAREDDPKDLAEKIKRVGGPCG